MVTLEVPGVPSYNTHILQAVTDLNVLGLPVQLADGGAVQGEQIQTTQGVPAEHVTTATGHVALGKIRFEATAKVHRRFRIVRV